MNIKKARLSHNMTQAQVAARLGVERSSYARYENGAREPDLGTLVLLSDIFDVSADYLLGRTDDPEMRSGTIEVGERKGIVLPAGEKSDKERTDIASRAKQALDRDDYVRIPFDNLDDPETLQPLINKLIPLIVDELEQRSKSSKSHNTEEEEQ